MDGYCERLGPGLLGEPLNAISNLAFLIAAAVLLIRSRRELLPWLLAVVGLCSLSFHTFANAPTAALDTGSILVFVLAAIVLLTRYGLGVSAARAWLAVPAFLGFDVVLVLLGPGRVLGGYLPALITLGTYAVLLRSRLLALAAGVFAVSLTVRTLDGPLCGSLPIGTHWLWHCLNATVLFLVAARVAELRRDFAGQPPGPEKPPGAVAFPGVS